MSHERNPPARQRQRPKRAAPRFKMPAPRPPAPPLTDDLSAATYDEATIKPEWRDAHQQRLWYPWVQFGELLTVTR